MPRHIVPRHIVPCCAVAIQCRGNTVPLQCCRGNAAWQCCRGNDAVAMLPWQCCRGNAAVAMLPWQCCRGNAAVAMMPWPCCHGHAAVAMLPWQRRCKGVLCKCRAAVAMRCPRTRSRFSHTLKHARMHAHTHNKIKYSCAHARSLSPCPVPGLLTKWISLSVSYLFCRYLKKCKDLEFAQKCLKKAQAYTLHKARACFAWLLLLLLLLFL